MTTFFRDSFIGAELLRGTQPEVGFRPDAVPWSGASYPGQPLRGLTRTGDGLKNVQEAGELIYGNFGFYVQYDASGNATRYDDVSTDDSAQWVPGSVEWEASFDFCPTFSNTGGSFFGAFIDLGSKRGGPVRIEIKAASQKWFFDATHPYGGLGRTTMPDALVPGTYPITLKHTRTKLTMTGGGGSFTLNYPEMPLGDNFDHVRVLPQSGIVLRNLQVGSDIAPVKPITPFWTGHNQTVES